MAGSQPIFFGNDDELFGIFYPAQGFVRRQGLLIAGPLLNEGMRAHSALRQVARRAARAGYDVLRFDYAGMGNSCGDVLDLSVDDWAENIAAASETLLDKANTDRLIVFAVRFSACLAHRLAARRPVEKIIAWDPLYSGVAWAERLEVAAQNMSVKFPRSGMDTSGVCLGYRVNGAFKEDLLAATAPDVDVQERFAVLGADFIGREDVERRHYDSVVLDEVADWETSASQVLFAHQTVDEIVGRLK